MKRNETDKLFGNLPACAVDFIKIVIKKMRYRKKVRREVLAELAAHFEDELRDCKTSEEKEQKAQQLINEFGDAKLLGILLRRAKKRCRPLWRTIVARTFQTAGILILCLIVYVGWFLTGKPIITTDYLAIINQMNRPQLAEEDNGWPHYEKAIELYVDASKELKDRDVFKNYKEIRSFQELAEDEKTEIKKWVQRNESAWQEFVAASKKSYCYREIQYNPKDQERWLFKIPLPELRTLRGLSKVGIWRSRIAVEQGRIKEGLKNCFAVIRTGRFWQEHKLSIIVQLAGMTLSGPGHQEILDIIANENLPINELKQLQQQLLDIYPGGYPLLDIEGEELLFMDIVQHTFTDGGPGGGHLIPEKLEYIMNILDNVIRIDEREFGKTLFFTGPAMYHAGRDKTVRKANEIYEKMAEIAKMTPYQRYINEVNSEDIILSVRKWRYFLISVFTPALDRASELAFQSKALHEATLTVLALLRFRQESGGYPTELDELLTAGYLKELPMDPYSDKPLVYKKTDDGFLLYSVGVNFKDDSGQITRDDEGKIREYADEGDWVFWPVPKSQIKQ